ncbi:NUDIX hydrolase [Sulfuriferula sp. AH1]|uniref:NUDIX hydrolase n=1 Tax=Sulfuriferula sp. AH1 TaxID=1985873 RepID=UPI000B3B6D20|nr:NUDIX hydrolase [Sulfuriferula sp. AH1]ARU30664.1 NUDIX hydrolase [Sulfuriferula sp. AH1]
MKFCCECGSPVNESVPAGDNRLRFVCSDCNTIHYQNPKMVVGCLPEWGNKILLCKRAIEPQYGKWTLPAGFMENGETTLQGAMRETLEEAGARVEISHLFTLYNLPYISQVYLMFRARLLDLDFAAGEESLEVALFSEEEIPWDEIAFLTIEKTLRQYFEDRRKGEFGFHIGDVERRNR